MLIKNRIASAIIAAGIIAGISSCSKSSDNSYTPSNPGGGSGTSSGPGIQLSSTTKYGNILTDSNGLTLYFFAIDANGQSGCNSGCTAAWPVFYAAGFTLSSGLNTSDFGVITRADGSKQTTYKGWPLYYYANDTRKGDINGDGVGGTWFVAKPDYSVMLVNEQLTGNDGKQYTSLYQPGQEVTQYLTDGYGHTLYAFSPDKFKKNTYTKSDFSNNPVWPVYEQSAVKYVPSSLAAADFDTVQIYGKVQLSYKGWPLYYFGRDSMIRGYNRGVSVPTPGVWPVVNKSSVTAAP